MQSREMAYNEEFCMTMKLLNGVGFNVNLKLCYCCIAGGVSMNYPSHFVLVPAQEGATTLCNSDGE